MLKNGVYLQVHFRDELKKLLEKFSDNCGLDQSKICELILTIELPLYVEAYLNKLEDKNETSTKNETSQKASLY